MRVIHSFVLGFFLCIGLMPSGWASDLSPEAVSILAGPCANCHLSGEGKRGAIPSLNGQSENHLRARLLAFHEGKAEDATVMTRLMKAYDRAQIDALAKWFSAVETK